MTPPPQHQNGAGSRLTPPPITSPTTPPPNPRRVAAGRRNRAKRQGVTPEGRERLREAATLNRPWLGTRQARRTGRQGEGRHERQRGRRGRATPADQGRTRGSAWADEGNGGDAAACCPMPASKGLESNVKVRPAVEERGHRRYPRAAPLALRNSPGLCWRDRRGSVEPEVPPAVSARSRAACDDIVHGQIVITSRASRRRKPAGRRRSSRR